VSISDIGLIALGGGSGAAARYAIVVTQARLSRWPGWTGVLAANLLGCLIIGLAAGSGSESPWSTALMMTGFAGALTTFSSFALDLALMTVTRAWAQLAWCSMLSLAAGIPLVLLGRAIGATWFGAAA